MTVFAKKIFFQRDLNTGISRRRAVRSEEFVENELIETDCVTTKQSESGAVITRVGRLYSYFVQQIFTLTRYPPNDVLHRTQRIRNAILDIKKVCIAVRSKISAAA